MDDFGPLEAGAAFALAGLLADQHAAKINRAIREGQHHHHDDDVAPTKVKHNTKWDAYVGQERLKRTLRVHIDSAKERNEPLPHVLLASGMPGVGKTEMGKLIASELGSSMVTLVPPFTKDQLVRTIQAMDDFDVVFIDEIHKMADNGKKNSETLLHILEEGQDHSPSGTIVLPRVTIVGATTDADRLPETIIDRFPIKPIFEPYTLKELALITAKFEGMLGIELPFELTMGIAAACRGTPRVAREMVVAARDLAISLDRHPTVEELLDFKQTEPDGMTESHRQYLQCLYENFGGDRNYTAGEDTLRVMLRQTKDGLLRLERFLIEQGYIELTPRGRRLLPKGIQQAQR